MSLRDSGNELSGLSGSNGWREPIGRLRETKRVQAALGGEPELTKREQTVDISEQTADIGEQSAYERRAEGGFVSFVSFVSFVAFHCMLSEEGVCVTQRIGRIAVGAVMGAYSTSRGIAGRLGDSDNGLGGKGRGAVAQEEVFACRMVEIGERGFRLARR